MVRGNDIKGKRVKGRQANSNRGPSAAARPSTERLGAPLEVETSHLDSAKNETVLRRYQQRWANEGSRFAIAVKSAQIGYSTATAAWAVVRCLTIPGRTVIFLSRSERQSLELAQRAKTWLDGYKGVVARVMPSCPFTGTSTLQHEIRFPNRSRIIALAANPDTARGYTGDVALDEFAFHQDSQAIFTAVYRQVSLGYHMRVLSTPNGQRGKFWEIAKGLGLDTGTEPQRQPVRALRLPIDDFRLQEGAIENRESTIHNPWVGHWCDIFLAVKEGAPLQPAEVRGGCDEDTWLQEYCCQFISQGSEWISGELFQQCVSSEATVASGQWLAASDQSARHSPLTTSNCVYAGWDIARHRDLSVIWLSELVGDVTWTRGVVEMRNTPTPEQIRQARSLMPLVRRMAIDKSGMGLVIFETLEREFPGQIEGVQFTQQTKEAMAVLAKRRLEEAKVRLPDSDTVRQAFRSVKKTVNAVGQVRFDAEHDARTGHADHWWAFCLAETAAQQPVYHFKGVAALIGRPITAGFRNLVL